MKHRELYDEESDPCVCWDGEARCLLAIGHAEPHDFGYKPLPRQPAPNDEVEVFRLGRWQRRWVDEIDSEGKSFTVPVAPDSFRMWCLRISQHGRTWRFASKQQEENDG